MILTALLHARQVSMAMSPEAPAFGENTLRSIATA